MLKIFRKIRKRILIDNKFNNYLLYAIGEIILVVIGILIALQVNNWNTERINKKRVNQYAKSLIQDLSMDIEMIDVSQFQAIKSYERIDSLRNYLRVTKLKNLSNTDLYVLTHDIMYKPFKWNRSTFEEMKNSEILQYFKSDSLKKRLMAYEADTDHLDEDYENDLSYAQTADHIASGILDLNNPYFTQMKLLETNNFNDPQLNLFQTEEYNKAKIEEHQLLTFKNEELKKFVNTYIQIQDLYQVRAFNEMKEIKENANEIISMLKDEMN